MKFRTGLATLAALAMLPASPIFAAPSTQSVDPRAGETQQQRDTRLKWLRQARFGMFIHWGLYSVPAGVWNGKEYSGIGEWIMHDARIPVADYAALAKRFNPTQFDAERWAQTAQDAGMKYMVITAKHHDGFAMFHSLSDPYNIYDATPFKRDPVAELAAACRKRNIKFGVYYSQAQDWHHAGGAAYGGHWDTAQDGSQDAYIRTVAAPQVKELLTRYKPAVLWWDTPVDMTPEEIRLLTEAFPSDAALITNNRLGNGVPGDTETPEQFIPATGYPGRDWETCMTINDTWGFKANDTHFKSGPDLLKNLIDIASKGGNYLLNVGPDSHGVIPAPEVDRLAFVGQWLKKNGRSIYGTQAGPFRRVPFDGRATVKGNQLFLHVFNWPAALSLAWLDTPVLDARVVATGESLAMTRAADGTLTLDRPAHLDPVATTIALKLAAPLKVTEPEPVIASRPDGKFVLMAADAEMEGETIKVQDSGENTNIGFWTNMKDAPHWTVSVPAGGAQKYRAAVDFSCVGGSEGSEVSLQVDGADTGSTAVVPSTGSWIAFQNLDFEGTVPLSPGKHVLRLMPKSKPGQAVMNLRKLTLTPAR